jgi:DNA (cytosine-5)-methyltransferase 1
VDHHFAFKNVGDMTKITEEMLDELGPVELLVGGTPCQSFSVAGLRGGLDDPRGNLALRFVQLAAVLKPEWIVWENVPGVLSSGKGRDFGAFLGALAELGYGFAYRVLDAQWFGVAQRRRRVFVVAHARDWRCAAAVLFERESVFGDSPTRGAERERTSISPALRAQPNSSHREHTQAFVPQVCPALKARDYKGPSSDGDGDGASLVPIAFKANISTPSCGHDVSETLQAENQCAVATPIDLRQASRGDRMTNNRATGSGGPPGSGVGRSGDPAFTVSERGQAVSFDAFNQDLNDNVTQSLRSSAGGGAYDRCVMYDGYNQIANEDISPSVRIGRDSGDCLVLPMAVRRLTPRECERLQGFPDDYTAITYRNKPACDGPRYKALGNSMAVPVMRWIGERISMVSELKKEVANVVV